MKKYVVILKMFYFYKYINVFQIIFSKYNLYTKYSLFFFIIIIKNIIIFAYIIIFNILNKF